MQFIVSNRQTCISIDDDFWKRAFTFAAKELQIEYHCANVICAFIEMNMERNVINPGVMTLGATIPCDDGIFFYVVATEAHPAPQFAGIGMPDRNQGQMVRTFFHEMTHVKQFLTGELIQKARHRKWKGEKWDNREYSFAPWEVEARAFADKAYDKFQVREVNRVMQDDSVHAYHPSIVQLCFMFPKDEVFHLTQKVCKDRERRALLSSERDWLLSA
jgi:hypothetical protein